MKLLNLKRFKILLLLRRSDSDHIIHRFGRNELDLKISVFYILHFKQFT